MGLVQEGLVLEEEQVQQKGFQVQEEEAEGVPEEEKES